MTSKHLRRIREYELDRVLPLIPCASTILEIGAGSGWQSKVLSKKGFVAAIDIPGSSYAEDRTWPIIQYDGINIPFASDKFDVVFSSNVLEHIPHVKEFQDEIKRILRRNGVVIHVLPTPTWRFWTILSFYPFLVKAFLRAFLSEHAVEVSKARGRVHKTSLPQRWCRNVLLPSRHGEVGNFLSEIYLFSRFRWTKLFESSGWILEAYLTNKLFYTGYTIFGPSLSFKLRKLLSSVLGSSCHIFYLRKQERADCAIQPPSNAKANVDSFCSATSTH